MAAGPMLDVDRKINGQTLRVPCLAWLYSAEQKHIERPERQPIVLLWVDAMTGKGVKRKMYFMLINEAGLPMRNNISAAASDYELKTSHTNTFRYAYAVAPGTYGVRGRSNVYIGRNLAQHYETTPYVLPFIAPLAERQARLEEPDVILGANYNHAAAGLSDLTPAQQQDLYRDFVIEYCRDPLFANADAVGDNGCRTTAPLLFRSEDVDNPGVAPLFSTAELYEAASAAPRNWNNVLVFTQFVYDALFENYWRASRPDSVTLGTRTFDEKIRPDLDTLINARLGPMGWQITPDGRLVRTDEDGRVRCGAGLVRADYPPPWEDGQLPSAAEVDGAEEAVDADVANV